MSKFKKNPPKKISDIVLKNFKKSPGKHFSVKQIFKAIPNANYGEVMAEVQRMVKQGLVMKENNRYILVKMEEKDSFLQKYHNIKLSNSQSKFIEGTVDMTSSGSAYIVSAHFKQDIYVHSKNMGSALHGDKVKVSLINRKSVRMKRPEGKVVDVIERASEEFIGTIHLSEKFAFLVLDKRNMPIDVFIPLSKINKAKDGDKAVAKIIEWHQPGRNPVGEIIVVLGKSGIHDVEMKSILVENGFPLTFSKEVLSESEALQIEISEAEIKRRRDFRKITTFTIDPQDAKDFDDAISFQQLNNGNYEIGVHIADVSHYVKPGSAMEKEALKRATSVYLVDRVLPMFPEKLSNEVCSLRPEEEKLCFAAVFEMNEQGEVLKEWFGKTVIFSDKRFSYEEAQKVLETKKGFFADELLTLNSLAKKLREARFKNGSINFETVEIKFVIDEIGSPLGIKLKERKDSNLLIEDFMLLANKKVASFIGNPKLKNSIPLPFVYRVHDLPDEEKLKTFSNFAAKLGYQLNLSTPKTVASSLNYLIEKINGKKEQNLLEKIAIRTMSKAFYTTKNIGHYGLAFDYYTHFTSPIRRYPDVMVHRLLEKYIEMEQEISEDGRLKKSQNNQLEEICQHASLMERNAMNAERESVKYKQVEYMETRVGDQFESIVSGVTEFGMFVEAVETKAEGLVRIQDMEDDNYKFDSENYCLSGIRSGKKFQMGDTVFVKLVAANLEKRSLDFVLIES